MAKKTKDLKEKIKQTTKTEKKVKKSTTKKEVSPIKNKKQIKQNAKTIHSKTKLAIKTLAKKAKPKKVFQTEYYDLPFGYNKTIVKVLAQTPKTLFVYWELSEDTINSFKKNYGENFFKVTKPILIVYNDTLNYSFEVEINDFANSWYIQINDSKCNYRVELGRKPLPIANNNYNKETSSSQYIPFYVYISTSNNIVSPNNKVLLTGNNIQQTLRFKNVKTSQIIEKNINNFKFKTNLGIVNYKNLYKSLYTSKNFEYENFFSSLPSSGTFSSQFK